MDSNHIVRRPQRPSDTAYRQHHQRPTQRPTTASVARPHVQLPSPHVLDKGYADISHENVDPMMANHANGSNQSSLNQPKQSNQSLQHLLYDDDVPLGGVFDGYDDYSGFDDGSKGFLDEDNENGSEDYEDEDEDEDEDGECDDGWEWNMVVREEGEDDELDEHAQYTDPTATGTDAVLSVGDSQLQQPPSPQKDTDTNTETHVNDTNYTEFDVFGSTHTDHSQEEQLDGRGDGDGDGEEGDVYADDREGGDYSSQFDHTTTEPIHSHSVEGEDEVVVGHNLESETNYSEFSDIHTHDEGYQDRDVVDTGTHAESQPPQQHCVPQTHTQTHPQTVSRPPPVTTHTDPPSETVMDRSVLVRSLLTKTRDRQTTLLAAVKDVVHKPNTHTHAHAHDSVAALVARARRSLALLQEQSHSHTVKLATVNGKWTHLGFGLIGQVPSDVEGECEDEGRGVEAEDTMVTQHDRHTIALQHWDQHLTHLCVDTHEKRLALDNTASLTCTRPSEGPDCLPRVFTTTPILPPALHPLPPYPFVSVPSVPAPSLAHIRTLLSSHRIEDTRMAGESLLVFLSHHHTHAYGRLLWAEVLLREGRWRECVSMCEGVTALLAAHTQHTQPNEAYDRNVSLLTHCDHDLTCSCPCGVFDCGCPPFRLIPVFTIQVTVHALLLMSVSSCVCADLLCAVQSLLRLEHHSATHTLLLITAVVRLLHTHRGHHTLSVGAGADLVTDPDFLLLCRYADVTALKVVREHTGMECSTQETVDVCARVMDLPMLASLHTHIHLHTLVHTDPRNIQINIAETVGAVAVMCRSHSSSLQHTHLHTHAHTLTHMRFHKKSDKSGDALRDRNGLQRGDDYEYVLFMMMKMIKDNNKTSSSPGASVMDGVNVKGVSATTLRLALDSAYKQIHQNSTPTTPPHHESGPLITYTPPRFLAGPSATHTDSVGERAKDVRDREVWSELPGRNHSEEYMSNTQSQRCMSLIERWRDEYALTVAAKHKLTQHSQHNEEPHPALVSTLVRKMKEQKWRANIKRKEQLGINSTLPSQTETNEITHTTHGQNEPLQLVNIVIPDEEIHSITLAHKSTHIPRILPTNLECDKVTSLKWNVGTSPGASVMDGVNVKGVSARFDDKNINVLNRVIQLVKSKQ